MKLKMLKDEQRINTQHTNTFYQRIDNISNVIFTDEETQLLSKGLKYNLHHKRRHWIQTLAIEADTAINLLLSQQQTYTRQAVTNKLQELINKEQTKRQTHVTKQ
jgi:hypothetical protein